MNAPNQTFHAALHKAPACDRIKSNRRPAPCPVCGKGAVAYLLPTTVVKDLPVKCKRCGAESILNIPLVRYLVQAFCFARKEFDL